jgi:hypothetical protein
MFEDVEQNGMFELVERDAWLDFFAAAPDDCVQDFGISSMRVGHIGLLASREVPMVEFNRAMCVGIAVPTSETQLDEAHHGYRRTPPPAGRCKSLPPHTHASFKIGCTGVA